MTWDRNHRQ